MKRYFYQALEENPIIAAIKNMDDLELLYDPDDRKTLKGRRKNRDRTRRPDRGFKQQGGRGGLH